MLGPKWLCWHAIAVAATAGMLWLADWQLRRALAGNGLSWAYTFEWPLFTVFGWYFWARTVRDELRIAGAGANADDAGPGSADGSADGPAATAEETSEAYLARLQAEVRRTHRTWHAFR